MKCLPYKTGDTINFSGQIGTKRQGVIEKIWGTNRTRDKQMVYFCHVKATPVYIWEKDPLFLIVCLTAGFYDHPYCQVDEKN